MILRYIKTIPRIPNVKKNCIPKCDLTEIDFEFLEFSRERKFKKKKNFWK